MASRSHRSLGCTMPASQRASSSSGTRIITGSFRRRRSCRARWIRVRSCRSSRIRITRANRSPISADTAPIWCIASFSRMSPASGDSWSLKRLAVVTRTSAAQSGWHRSALDAGPRAHRWRWHRREMIHASLR
jgi:hypothetical protein